MSEVDRTLTAATSPEKKDDEFARLSKLANSLKLLIGLREGGTPKMRKVRATLEETQAFFSETQADLEEIQAEIAASKLRAIRIETQAFLRKTQVGITAPNRPPDEYPGSPQKRVPSLRDPIDGLRARRGSLEEYLEKHR